MRCNNDWSPVTSVHRAIHCTHRRGGVHCTKYGGTRRPCVPACDESREVLRGGGQHHAPGDGVDARRGERQVRDPEDYDEAVRAQHTPRTGRGTWGSRS